MDAARAVLGRKGEGALGAFAGGKALGGVFDAVVHRIADEVGQRFAKALDHRLVQLGAFTRDHQIDMLAGAGGELAQDTGHAREHAANRLGADRHGAFLNVAGQAFEQGQLFIIADGLARETLGQHRLGDHQLAHRVDQLVEFDEIDADRLPLRRGGGGGLAGGRRGAGFGGRDC